MTDDLPAPPPPPVGPPPPSGETLPAPVEDRSLLDIGTWLTDTTRTLVHGFGHFFGVLTLVSLVSTAASAPLLWLSSRDAVLTRDGDGVFTSVEGMSGDQGVMVAAGLFIILTSQVLLFTAATHHIDRVRNGEVPSWQETARALVVRGPRVIGVVGLVVLGAFAILLVSGIVSAVGLGGVGAAVGFAAIVLLWLRCAVASTHAALRVPGSSIGASFTWTKGRTWPLLGRHVLLVTIAFGFLLISSFVAAPFQSLSGAAPLTGGDVMMRDLIGTSVPAFLAVQFINALAVGFVAAVWASAMLSMYRGEPLDG